MNTYKNLEIYKAAFNLAIKVYRLNITLPVTALLNQGNKLRWTSLKIKDLIAEGFSGRKETEEMIRILNTIIKLNQEVISLLKKIRTHNAGNKQIPDLIKSYKELGQKTEEHIASLQSEKTEYRIRFPESYLMEKAG
jgi:four helix bundle protein